MTSILKKIQEASIYDNLLVAIRGCDIGYKNPATRRGKLRLIGELAIAARKQGELTVEQLDTVEKQIEKALS